MTVYFSSIVSFVKEPFRNITLTESLIMAVTPKTAITADRNSGSVGAPQRFVHYIKLGKGNRKGTAQTIGGTLYDHLGNKTAGDFHIVLVTKINNVVKTVNLEAGDVVFRTGTSKRWQVITLKGFKRRFPELRV